MWKTKFGLSNGSSEKKAGGGDSSSKGVPNAAEAPVAPQTPGEQNGRGGRGKKSGEFHDWQLDSHFDSKNLTTTRDLDDFMATLAGPVPLANLSESLRPYAKQMEADIDSYLQSGNKDMPSKCMIAQDILRMGIERSMDLVDELYLQLLKHLRGSNKTTSVRGWELLLLAACASRPSSRLLEPVTNFVHSSSHAKVQWPTTASILAKRTWTALKHNTKPGRRVNVPSVGEIASVLSSKSMKVQISFVDGSNKWLFYDWTTTVSSAVEQLASQIGLKNYQDYTLFEARKVPKKLDREGSGSVATLPPDTYLLLEDNRRIADVLHDYEVRGAENKLLLKRRRFDSSGADFSKPQFIALTEAHQAAMDEKVAEVANLTLRLREMSGKVMWHETQQSESASLAETLKKKVQDAEARVKEVELKGVSVDAAAVMKERDSLAERVKQLEEEAARKPAVNVQGDDSMSEGDSGRASVDNLPIGLVRKLAEKHEEINRLQAELDVLRPLVTPEQLAHAAVVAANSAANSSQHSSFKSMDQGQDMEADESEKEALYGMLRHESALREQHAHELEQRSADVDHLNELVEDLTHRLKEMEGLTPRRGNTDTQDLCKSLDENALQDLLLLKEQQKTSGVDFELESKLTTMQDALEQQTAMAGDLEAELEGWKQKLQHKEGGFRNQEKEWRGQLNMARAESAKMASRLKAREAALSQATADLDELHREAGLLRTELDNRQWEVESLQRSLETATAERDAATAELKALKHTTGSRPIPGLADSARSLKKSSQDVSQLTERLQTVTAERNAAVDKLAGIQQLMAGMGFTGLPGDTPKGSKRNSLERVRSGTSQRPSLDRGRESKHDVCPLEIGRDPRRESIGGESAPNHLRGLPPLRVLPEDKRVYGTRHPLFAPNYVSPLIAATPEKREHKVLKQEAAAMLNAADAKRRLYEQKRRGERLSREERPAPKSKAAPQTVENINSGTHLLGLLSNTHITHSHESMEYSDTKIEDTTGLFPDLMRSTSSQISYDQQARGAGEQQMDRSNSLSERQKSLHSTGMTSTQSEPDLLKAYEAALRSED